MQIKKDACRKYPDLSGISSTVQPNMNERLRNSRKRGKKKYRPRIFFSPPSQLVQKDDGLAMKSPVDIGDDLAAPWYW